LYRYTGLIATKVYGGGIFGAHHVFHVLAQLKLCRPLGILHSARFATGTGTLASTTIDENTSNPWMRRYLHPRSGNVRSAPGNQHDRARRLAESVVPNIQQAHKVSYFCRLHLEQIQCECNRGKIGLDFQMPMANNLYLPPNSTNSRTLQQLHPIFQISTGEFIVEKSLAEDLPLREGLVIDSVIPLSSNRKEVKVISTRRTGAVSAQSIRIPPNYISCFSGLLEEIQEMFFPQAVKHADSGGVMKEIQQHHILRVLVAYFAKHPMPLEPEKVSNDQDDSGGDPRTNHKPPAYFAYLAPARFSVSSSNATQQPLSGTHEGTCHTCTAKDVATVSSELSSNNLLPMVRAVSPTKISDQKNRAVSGSSTNLVVGLNVGPLPPLVTLSSFGRFTYFQFTSPDQCMVASFKSFGGLTTLKKVETEAAKNSKLLNLGDLHNEVKSALFYGQASAVMPLSMSAQFIQNGRPCDNSTHSSPGGRSTRTSFHKAYWTEDSSLPFFQAGTCALVDKIAICLCGTKALVVNQPGKIEWLFRTQHLAKRHLLLCILFLGGKLTYFYQLMRRAKRLCATEKILTQTTQAVTVVTSSFPDSPLFYLILTHVPEESNKKKGDTGLKDSWALVLPNLSFEEHEGLLQVGPSCLFLDLWKWKQLPFCSSSAMISTKKKRKRSRRKVSQRQDSFSFSQPSEVPSLFSDFAELENYMSLEPPCDNI
jgi:hypothetical protein